MSRAALLVALIAGLYSHLPLTAVGSFAHVHCAPVFLCTLCTLPVYPVYTLVVYTPESATRRYAGAQASAGIATTKVELNGVIGKAKAPWYCICVQRVGCHRFATLCTCAHVHRPRTAAHLAAATRNVFRSGLCICSALTWTSCWCRGAFDTVDTHACTQLPGGMQ